MECSTDYWLLHNRDNHMMLVDFDRRGTGKTDRMIEWLRNDPARILVVYSATEATRLQRKWPEVGTRIITWAAYWSRRPEYVKQGFGINEIGIDGADKILQRLVFHRIGRMSLTHYTEPDDGPWNS